MTLYANAFPKRTFIHETHNYGPYTESFTRYDSVFRVISHLFNVRILRKTESTVIFVGRKEILQYLPDLITTMIREVEMKVTFERDQQSYRRTIKCHLSEHINSFRSMLIEKLISELLGIAKLKKEYYLDKYARIRAVRDNELLDQAFFPEYLREHRLHHLKKYKWHID